MIGETLLAGPIRTKEETQFHMEAFDDYKESIPLGAIGLDFFLVLYRKDVKILCGACCRE